MFKRIDLAEVREEEVEFDFEGRRMSGLRGEPIAAALLANGITATRTTVVSGTERGAHCMMGVCFECLVQVDGRPNVQACMTPLEAGMRVCRQLGPRAAGVQS